MKLSAAAATIALASGVLAKPAITNSEINPQEGKPFVMTVSGCDAGCTVYLQSGPNSSQLTPFRVVAQDVTKSATITLSDLGSGTYSFRILDNSAKDPTSDEALNYSVPFEYKGTGPTSFPPLSGSATATPSSASSSASSASATESSSASSASSATTPSATTPSTTSGSTATSDSSASSATSVSSTGSSATTTTTSKSSSSTTSARATNTTPPSNAGSLLGVSPVGLVGAAAVAFFL